MTSASIMPLAATLFSLALVSPPSATAAFTQQGNKLVGTPALGPSSQGDGVALSADGNTLAVGGSSDNNFLGAVWIYTRANGVWTQQAKLIANNVTGPVAGLGYWVALSGDGNTLIAGGLFDNTVGQTSVGAAWIFTRAGGGWSQQAKLIGSGGITAQQGASVAISSNGNTAIVGGLSDNGNAGAAWIFTRSGTVWTQQGVKLVGTGAVGLAAQGVSVALAGDGDTALLGGFGDSNALGATWVFTRSGSTWSQQAKLVGTGASSLDETQQGISTALSSDGNTALVGGNGDASGMGAAWVFTRVGGQWTQQGSKLVGSGAQGVQVNQGFSVALSGDGNTAIIGGPVDAFTGQGLDSTGAAWVFQRTGGAWTQNGTKLVGSGGVHGTIPNTNGQPDGPQQGWSVAISSDGGTVAVGGDGDNSNIGAAWVFIQPVAAPPHFTFTVPPSATANSPFNFTVTAQDANNATVTSYTGTVHFTSTDGSATLPSDTTLTNGAGNLPVTLRTNGGQTITATDTANPAIAGTSNTISVTSPTVPKFSLSAPSTATANAPFNFTVTAQDANGATLTGYTGTVHFTSTDPAATLPSNTTLANGTGTFPATLRTAGSQTIGANDTVNFAMVGTSNLITVPGTVPTGGPNYTQQGNKLVGAPAIENIQRQGAVALSADGNTLAVGAQGDNVDFGAVFIYTRINGNWTPQAKLIGAGTGILANQGASVALSADGNTCIFGARNDSSSGGSVHVFTRNGATWTQQGPKLTATGATGAFTAFGTAVAISSDGNTAAIGAARDNASAGATYIFIRTGSTWTQQGAKLVGTGAVNGSSGAQQGLNVAISGDGNTVAVGGNGDAIFQGAVWVFTRGGATWNQQGSKFTGFGGTGAVALSNDGNTLLIGSTADGLFGTGTVYTRGGGVWTQQSKLIPTGGINTRIRGIGLGYSVAVSNDGNTAVLGGPFDNGFAPEGTVGATWVFKRSNGVWSQHAKLLGSGGVAAVNGFLGLVGPFQGSSVATSSDGSTVAIGGNQDNGTVGAAWVFALTNIRLSISAPSSVAAGTPFNFTVSALDGNNNPIAAYNSKVHFTSSDVSAVLPADSALPGGTATFSATLRFGGSQTLTATDISNTAITATGNITVNGAPGLSQWYSQQGNKLVGSGASGAAMQGPVALSQDGNTLAVGGAADNTGTGAVWIYTRTNGVWSQQGSKMTGPGAVGAAGFGSGVALSADGNTLLVGGSNDSSGAGAVWVFTRTNGVWTQQGGKLLGSGAVGAARQGFSVALSLDGNTAAFGGHTDSTNAGALWIFTRSGGVWTQQGNKLVGTGATGAAGQGSKVAISGDGNTVLAGGSSDGSSFGAAWVFVRNGSAWSQQGGKLTPNNAVTRPGSTQLFFGQGIALSGDGNTAAITGWVDSNSQGATWIFQRNGGAWSQFAKLVSPDLDTPCSGCGAQQGQSVAMTPDGNTLLVGSPGDSGSGLFDATGAAAIFRRQSNGSWLQTGPKIIGSGGIHWTLPNSTTGQGPAEGRSVAISGDGSTAAVGGSGDDTNNGAVWIFTLPRFSFNTPATVTGGTPFNFTVSALNAANQPVSDYFGTLHFSSSDGAATLPADASLSSGMLSLSATLRTTPTQTLSAVDNANPGERGTSDAINLGSAGVVPPTPVSVSPAGGNSQSQTMTFLYTDPRGFQDINVVNILVNNFIDGRQACYLAYVRSQGLLVLVNDGGDAGGPYAGNVNLGNSNPIQNSQCSVVLVSATGSGNNLTLVLNITWKTPFAGDKIVHMAARDVAENNSGWYPLGVWRVPGGFPSVSTAIESLNPFRGTGPGPTQFTFTFSDTLGYQHLGVENILVNDALDGRRACYLAFSRPANLMFLVNDNGDGLLPGKSMASADSVANSQCTVSWTGTPVTASGNTLTLVLTIAFSGSFRGNRIIYVAARDVNEANNTDWHAMGTWTNSVTQTIGRPPGSVLDTANPLSTGLVGLFLMNQGSGTVDRNLVTNQDAIFSGASLPTWNTADPSIVFNGGTSLNSYLNAGTDLIFDKLTTSQMTIVAKVFLHTASSNGIAEKNDVNSIDSGFVFGIASNGGLQFTVERSSSNMRVLGTVVPSGKWIQVAATWDGTVGTADAGHLFLDGTELTKVLNNTGSGTLGFANATNQPFRIGNASFDFPSSLNGRMQYLLVYKGRILTADELKQLDMFLPIR